MHPIIAALPERYPALKSGIDVINAVTDTLIHTFANGNTLFLAGNGGSAADAEHIAGELLKGFLSLRELPAATKARFAEVASDEGAAIAAKLQGGLRTVSLLSHPGLTSAFANDVDASLIYAQQLYALSRPGDAVLGISTGGNADNVYKMLITARALGIKSILLTGNKHGKCERFADMVIAVDASETYKIQELHLPVYHAICAAVEAYFFAK